MLVDRVVVGHIGSVVTFEMVNCLGEGLIKMGLHSILEGAQRPVSGIGTVEEGGNIVGVCVPLVGCGLDSGVITRLSCGEQGSGAQDVVLQERCQLIACSVTIV